MKIEAKCHTCGRTFLLSQIGEDSDAPGRCPFCGARFARHYSPVLIETVTSAEHAATQFVRVMGRLRSLQTGFDVDFDEVLRTISEQVRAEDDRATAG